MNNKAISVAGIFSMTFTYLKIDDLSLTCVMTGSGLKVKMLALYKLTLLDRKSTIRSSDLFTITLVTGTVSQIMVLFVL